MADFLMPSLGADMEHGKIVEWLVKPGDYVRRGDLVAVVDTDKTVMDVESFQEGVVAELLVDPGATVPIGTPLARITPTPAEVGAPVRRAPVPSSVPVAVVRRRGAPGPGRRRAGRPRGGSPDRPSGAASGAPAGRRHGQDPRHRQGRRHHAGRRGARRGGEAVRRTGAVLPAGPEARRRTRRRAFRRQRQRPGGCRDRGGRAARRGQPDGSRGSRRARSPAGTGTPEAPQAGQSRGSPRARRQPAPGRRRPDVTLEEDHPALLPEHHPGPAGRRRVDAVRQRAAAGGRPGWFPRRFCSRPRRSRPRTCRRSTASTTTTAGSGPARPCTSASPWPCGRAASWPRPSTTRTPWPWTC